MARRLLLLTSGAWLLAGLIAAAKLLGVDSGIGVWLLILPAIPLHVVLERLGLAEKSQGVLWDSAHSPAFLTLGGLLLVYFLPSVLIAFFALRRGRLPHALVGALAIVVLGSCGRVSDNQAPPEAASQRAVMARHVTSEDTKPRRVGGDVKPPVVISRVEPTYPTALKAHKRAGGVILLEGVITKNGTVRDVRIVKGAGDPLAPYVRNAVERWRFQPATLHGEPVDVIYNISTYIHVR